MKEESNRTQRVPIRLIPEKYARLLVNFKTTTCRKFSEYARLVVLNQQYKKTKCAFHGSDLEKTYSAKGLQERCRQEVLVEPKVALTVFAKVQQAKRNFNQPERLDSPLQVKEITTTSKRASIAGPSYCPDSQDLLDFLAQPEPTDKEEEKAKAFTGSPLNFILSKWEPKYLKA